MIFVTVIFYDQLCAYCLVLLFTFLMLCSCVVNEQYCTLYIDDLLGNIPDS